MRSTRIYLYLALFLSVGSAIAAAASAPIAQKPPPAKKPPPPPKTTTPEKGCIAVCEGCKLTSGLDTLIHEAVSSPSICSTICADYKGGFQYGGAEDKDKKDNKCICVENYDSDKTEENAEWNIFSGCKDSACWYDIDNKKDLLRCEGDIPMSVDQCRDMNCMGTGKKCAPTCPDCRTKEEFCGPSE